MNDIPRRKLEEILNGSDSKQKTPEIIYKLGYTLRGLIFLMVLISPLVFVLMYSIWFLLLFVISWLFALIAMKIFDKMFLFAIKQ